MFDRQTNLLVLLLIAFSGFDLILSDCGADVDRSHSGYCNNRQDLNRFEDLNYRKDSEKKDGRVIRERFDFSGRQRVNRFDRGETRRNFNGNHRLATSIDARMIHREIPEARSRLNNEREREFENLNVRNNFKRSSDFTRRDGRIIREDETRKDLNYNRQLATSTDTRMIRREIMEGRSRLNDERKHSNVDRRDIRMENRMERTDHRRIDAERREPDANRFENRMERADERREVFERLEPIANRMEQVDQRRISSEMRDAKANRKYRMERGDERRISSRRYAPNTRYASNDQSIMNSQRREHFAHRMENRLERADKLRVDYEGREFNGNRIEQAYQRRMYSGMRDIKANRDNSMENRMERSGKISVLSGAKYMDKKSTNAIWTWSIIQFALIGLIVSKVLKHDECLKSKSFGVYARGFLNTNTDKSIKAL